MTLVLDLNDDLCRAIYLFGTHEPDTTAFLHRRLGDPHLHVVYDVGANIGSYAIAAAAMLQNRGYVEAFEPVPWIFEQLKKNCSVNNLTNLRIHRIAVGRENGMTTLFLPHGLGAWSANATMYPELAKTFNALFALPGTPIDTLSVPCKNLDSLIERRALRPPDLVRNPRGRWWFPYLVVFVFPDGPANANQIYAGIIVPQLENNHCEPWPRSAPGKCVR